jgi:hypothetical protein
VSWNLRWRFNARSDGYLDIVVLLRRRSEGGMNNFVTEDASIIPGKGRAGRPSVIEETVDIMSKNFTRSPTKSVLRASRDLQILQTFLFQMVVTPCISVQYL